MAIGTGQAGFDFFHGCFPWHTGRTGCKRRVGNQQEANDNEASHEASNKQ